MRLGGRIRAAPGRRAGRGWSEQGEMMAGRSSPILCTSGFATLALAMALHHEQLLRRRPGPGRQWA
uniref:DUF3325 family protein n=1 Tax=Paracoccus binzhouensis TaxID=2796149 RepID=UPI0038CD226C